MPTPQASSQRKWLVIIAGATVVGVLAGLLLPHKADKLDGRQAVPGPTIAPPAPPPVAPEPTPARPIVAPMVPAEIGRPAQSHIEITVQPAQASLSLDDRVAGGNVLRLDVEKAHGAHVVYARAPGYYPFKKSISFANDVSLEIRLVRKPGAYPARVGARALPPQATAQATRSEARIDTGPPPVAKPVEDYGMTLQRPTTTRRPTRKMDETDPYAP